MDAAKDCVYVVLFLGRCINMNAVVYLILCRSGRESGSVTQ